jgi:predicted nuclease of predicted toxin-antitoxin system
MKLWLDAQLSPVMARWLNQQFGVDAVAVRGLGLLQAKDRDIFLKAREAGAVVVTKDRDFIALLDTYGPPPQVLWITCGNTSNARLQEILLDAWATAAKLLGAGEPLVEISEKDS